MPTYDTYPAVDENNEFPPVVREAVANSIEINDRAVEILERELGLTASQSRVILNSLYLQLVNTGATGRALIKAESQLAARSSIGAGTSSLVLGTTATTAKKGDWVPSFSEVTGVLGTNQLPALAINDVFPVASQAAMLALNAQRGDIAIRSDESNTYILATDSPGTLTDWKQFTATGDVISVAGKTGTIVLSKSDVGLSNVDNTSDANKPISTATQTALNGKAEASHTHPISAVSNLQTELDKKAGQVEMSIALQGKSDTSHTHSIGTVNGLQTALDGKAATSHSHTMGNVTGLQTALDGKANTTHTHSIANVTNLQTELDKKSTSGHGHTIDQVVNLQAYLDDKSSTVHTHTKSDIGLGNVDNIADIYKPVSNATRIELDIKNSFNIFKNGSFEYDYDTLEEQRRCTVTRFGNSAGTARTGECFLRATATSSTDGLEVIFKRVPVEEGRTYRAEVYVKSQEANTTVQLVAVLYDTAGAGVFTGGGNPQITIGTTYTKLSWMNTVGPGKDTLGFRVGGPNNFLGKYLDIDDLTITDVTDVVNLVRSTDLTATTTQPGLMASTYKNLLDRATHDYTVSTIMMRDYEGNVRGANYYTNAAQSTLSNSLTRRDYVDTAVGTKLHKIPSYIGGGVDLNTLTDNNAYHQRTNANAASGTNYPVPIAGLLEVRETDGYVYQTYKEYNSGMIWVRTYYASVWFPWKRLSDSSVATTAADGLMSIADKTLLEYATYYPNVNTLVKRDVNGQTRVATPTVNDSAANKKYVDDAIKAVSGGSPFVNVKDFGAKGDGTTDDLAAIQAAVAAAPAGAIIFFPPGNYYHPAGNATTEAGFVTITKSGTTLMASPGSATLTNMQIYLKGTYGGYISVGSGGIVEGAKAVSVGTHGLSVGDYFQILGEKNAYTPDGGKWQLGSTNPTYGTTPDCRLTEIHRVSKVYSASTVELDDLVTYDYKANTTGLSSPMTGVTTSQIRKLNALKDITFSGLKFVNTGSSFRGIVARACVNLLFEKCLWEASDNPGSHVKVTDSLNTVFSHCKSVRYAMEAGSGSSWNSFMIGGGCHRSTFDNCEFVGESQTIDFTPNTFNTSSDIGHNAITEYQSIQYMRIANCSFTNCSDSGTSHPGSYYFEYLNNRIMGGSTGVRARSRSSKIKGNTIYTSRVGVNFGAFCSDTVVENNECVQIPSTVGKLDSFYVGIDYGGVGSEINNGNFVEDVLINHNRITVNTYNINSYGISLSHNPPSGYVGFTTAQKVKMSYIVISNNIVKNTSIVVGEHVHGTKIEGNTMQGYSNRESIIECRPNSARNLIMENTFDNNSSARTSVRTGALVSPTSGEYGYSFLNRVAPQVGPYAAPSFALVNWVSTVTTSPS